MRLEGQADRLKIFVGEADRHGGKLLVEVIVEAAKRGGLAGATAFRGVMGFGANSQVHYNKILRLSEGMPVIIEIVDTPEKIDDFLPFLNDVIKEGLVTRERVEVIHYRHSKKD